MTDKRAKSTSTNYYKKLFFQPLKHSKNKLLKHLEHPISDLYHWLLVISWGSFLILTCLFYLFINIVFALAYLTTQDGIANAKPGSFSDAFFFSVLYKVKDILWSMRFVDILHKNEQQEYTIDYRHFHDVIALDKE